MFGYKNALDYWEDNRSNKYTQSITLPTLIINALNDPFLGDKCFSCESPSKGNIILYTPKSGGHCGFLDNNLGTPNWADRQILDFINDLKTRL